jgi:hypothetical protein
MLLRPGALIPVTRLRLGLELTRSARALLLNSRPEVIFRQPRFFGAT